MKPGDFHRAFCVSERIDDQNVNKAPSSKIITAKIIRVAMTMLRFLAGDGCFLSFFAGTFFAGTFFAGTFFTGTFSPERIEGVFSSEWARKKPAGGGKSGGEFGLLPAGPWLRLAGFVIKLAGHGFSFRA
jgi:hypothetical protein